MAKYHKAVKVSLIIVALGVAAYLFAAGNGSSPSVEIDASESPIPYSSSVEGAPVDDKASASPSSRPIVSSPVGSTANPSLPKKVKYDVPFAAQAPFGDWDDPRQQDGCEEASMLMAVRWARGEELTREEALSQILAFSAFEVEKHGGFHDTSASDTAAYSREFFGYEKIRVANDVLREDIKRELARGNLVVVPADGTKLKNPYFTPPGPIRHMLVITGYDDAKGVFITNDPGTRRGEDFAYSYAVMEDAMLDYPTGYHEPIEELRKAMIVIEPSS